MFSRDDLKYTQGETRIWPKLFKVNWALFQLIHIQFGSCTAQINKKTAATYTPRVGHPHPFPIKYILDTHNTLPTQPKNIPMWCGTMCVSVMDTHGTWLDACYVACSLFLLFGCIYMWDIMGLLRAHKTALKIYSIMSNSFLKKAHQSLIIFQ